jgi:hypothetical protein
MKHVFSSSSLRTLIWWYPENMSRSDSISLFAVSSMIFVYPF